MITDRLTWLRDRQTGVGGTDIASLCGVGFCRAAEVYAEKVAAEPIDREPSNIMLLGLATEDLNAALYARKTGARLFSPGLVRATSEPWAFATLDRVRRDECDPDSDRAQAHENFGCPVELKYVGPFFGDEWGADGSDEIKDGYTIQATWEALVLRLNGHDVRRTDVSALSGAGEHRVYPVPFDAQLAEQLLDIGRAFWTRVEARAGADDWQHPLLPEVEKRLAQVRPDTSVQLPADAVAMADAYELYKADEKRAREFADGVKAGLLGLLGTAETGVLPDGRRVQQKLVRRDGYTVDPSTYTRFSILKAKKGKVRDE